VFLYGAKYASAFSGNQFIGRGFAMPLFSSDGTCSAVTETMVAIRRVLSAFVLLFVAAATYADDAVPKGPLPRTIVPSLVQLELRLDPAQPRFSGKVRMEAKVSEATDAIWMHGRTLTISKAEAILAGGKRVAMTAEDADVSGVLKLSLAEKIPAGNAVIEIAYDAPFGELQGAYRVVSGGNNYVVTQMEPLGARNTFPGFDEPSFKQPWDIALIVPEKEIAVANSREIKTEKLAEGWKKVTFARTEALPSYLIAFAVGPWDLPQGPDIAPHGSRKTPIKLRGVAAKGQGERMRYALDHTPAITHALEDYFGTPYPFDKLDNVAAPDFSAGAMENAGLIVYRDTLMFINEDSPVSVRQAFWGVSTHEIAHQWFGNLVTMEWWDDLWLNEAFATWLGNKITGQLQPQFHMERSTLEGGIAAMTADSLASTRRIREPITEFTQIQSAFDLITYRKGGAVLSMFENYVGETQFRDGVRKYLKQHARGNATSSDLIAAVAAQSKDAAAVDAAFKSYIEQPGVPFLNVDVKCGAGKPALVLQQQRYVPIGSSASTKQTWGIPLTVRYADGAQVREEKGIVTGAQGSFELKQAQGCPTWVMPNGHGAGYFRFALTPRWQQTLSQAFAKLDEREQRVYADSITSAYDAGVLTSAQLLAALPQLARAQSRQTVTAGTTYIRWMKENLLTASNQAEFLSSAAEMYRPRLQQLGFSSKQGESDEDRLLRGALIGVLADTLEDKSVRAEMIKSGRVVLGLDTDGKLYPNAVSSDVRAVALSMAVEEGGKQVFDAAEKHFRTSSDPVLRTELLGALGSSNDPALAKRARALVFEQNLLRRNEIFALVGSQADEPALRSAVREWLDEHFAELDAKITPASAGIVNVYATGMCDADDVAELESKFTERMKTIEGGPLALKQASERVRLCAAAKEKRAGQPLRFEREAVSG
jgi:cytosol alanyl aminopeptidase